MKRLLCSAIILTTITACGGGGSGGSGSTPGTNPPVTPPVAPVQTVNAADALNKLLFTKQSLSKLKSNDGSLGTASLLIDTEEAVTFVTNGVQQKVSSSRKISLLESGESGRLLRRYGWRIDFDDKMKPVGMAYAGSSNAYDLCQSVTSKNDLPAVGGDAGVYFSGIQSRNYLEGFKSGTYAHYCDPAAAAASDVQWSVVKGSPNPYFCLTLPVNGNGSKTRVCLPVDSAGAMNGSAWVTRYNTDGIPSIDYKDTTLNKPVEEFSTTIDQKNYWYGIVRRPLDGYVYQTYEDTKFSSLQACREQTQIDWKKTWSADNIGWSCINTQTK